jgi:F-type H+-transporting ATPase subunit delta
MSLAVANQYAKALLEVLSAPGAQPPPEEALTQLEEFGAMLTASPDLNTILHSPAVDLARKKAVVTKLGGLSGMSQVVRNFLVVVISRRRLGTLKEILEMFRARLDERAGVARAVVTSARTLSPADRSALEERLIRTTGKQVRCSYSVDAALTGGATIRVGSRMYDGSVHGQLDLLRGRLAAKA